ncbi:SAA protein, partial [Myiagra hebetior]|nr:SAA protein [Myiagra hebetior]
VRLSVCIVLFSMVVCASAQSPGLVKAMVRVGKVVLDVLGWVLDMFRAYQDTSKANYKDIDKHFNVRENYDALWRGCGRAWSVKVISYEDTWADSEANARGRSCGDSNRYRPAGAP